MGDAARHRLLAVDDDPTLQRGLRKVLGEYGEAVVLGTAEEARREIASGAPIDAMIFDLRLDDGTGLELLAYARERCGLRAPVVILSGHVEGWVTNEAFDWGADTLGKPLDPSRLRKWLERALGQAHAPAIETLEPELRTKVEALRALLEHEPTDTLTRYRIGAVVAELKSDTERYGERAVALAAASLNQDEASLYRHARVAERWTFPEFEALVSRTRRDGRSPSWSHMVQLSSVTSAPLLRDIFQRMLEENLSVRQLDEALCDVAVQEPDTGR
jgi:DNA-binding response OmpR family regulator